ncbi:hypothetical protein LGL55_16300 [Clostridium tagluense]|uniref:hypothetical protein n=1 Tax=Clostridium tagluense TaxID=360422 RepID=UPI001C0E6DB4|nr:hypothetical protein [Clostridium tagluense]MBU3128645.1 hypothetical protein [Clostridium tagluense]MBW9158576.1 hypothetical protein [Clostridium tagluense]MCB2299292.1 hypothetical protein [Clostridium tagluense]MCB2312764.1 hypothetical protein [Clostridium tagluense]MCB2317530.1 hypothetical protein [Clostridium tagluense]
MGLITLDKVEKLDKKLDDIEKHLVRLEVKIDTISKENNSIKSIEANIAKIKNLILEIKK